MKKKILIIGLILLSIGLLSSCADVSNIDICLLENEHTYGFWGGLWHGIIVLFSFIGSLFSDDIAVYAVNNSGGWYDFGFWIGTLSFGGGSGSAARNY